jgi:hypothetical protein
MIDWFERNVPYYINHLLVAVAISIGTTFVTGIPMAWPGGAFYLVREIWQRYQKGYWDWPGLLWPCVPCFTVELAL